MNTILLNKALRRNIKYIFEHDLHYNYFTKGDYNLNIIGIRANNNRKITNKYDDVMLVIYYCGNEEHIEYFSITTEPGDYYMRKNLGNPKGTAILVPGQYIGCWKIGKHNGKYDALVQQKPVKVYRDGNKDDIYDMYNEVIHEGLFGINIHRSNQGFNRATVDMYSAGCQVFNNPKEFDRFMQLCKKQRELYGNSFTYTLIDEEDLT